MTRPSLADSLASRHPVVAVVILVVWMVIVLAAYIRVLARRGRDVV